MHCSVGPWSLSQARQRWREHWLQRLRLATGGLLRARKRQEVHTRSGGPPAALGGQVEQVYAGPLLHRRHTQLLQAAQQKGRAPAGSASRQGVHRGGEAQLAQLAAAEPPLHVRQRPGQEEQVTAGPLHCVHANLPQGAHQKGRAAGGLLSRQGAQRRTPGQVEQRAALPPLHCSHAYLPQSQHLKGRWSMGLLE